ncbi:MAG TPA: head maturation protease, ClpP-related [Pirellulales bacterium]|jgi:ATP-dependent protease ClpP protease subunit
MGRIVDILIYDAIDSNRFEGISASDIAQELKAAGSVSMINVRINSNGGSVFESIAIHNLLSANPARKVVWVDGACFSGASIVAMCGETINMAASAWMMIHEVSLGMNGGAEDLARGAKLVEDLNLTTAEIYADRTKQKLSSIVQMMKAETWLDAEQAVAFGFADHITAKLNFAASCPGSSLLGLVPALRMAAHKQRQRDARPASPIRRIAAAAAAGDTWPELVAAKVAAGVPRAKAVSQIESEHPGLRESYLRAFNLQQTGRLI